MKHIAYKLTDYTGNLINPFNENARFNDVDYAKYLNNTFDTPDEVIEKILEVYEINCSNMHNLQAAEFDKLIEKYKTGKDFNILCKIIALVRRAHSDSTFYDNGVVDEICSYIIENLESNCSVESIADKFNFSANYIRHIFKKKTGISISEFKKTQILKKARLLLKASDRKITDIAAECGYDNPSYFSKVFKNEVGVSPKDYRQGC